MTDETMNLETLVKGYSRNIRQLEKELATLQSDADELAVDIQRDNEKREAARANLEALKRTQASLETELDSIRAEFGEASLDNDVAEQQRIRKRKREIDSELATVQEDIRNVRIVDNSTDLNRRAATLTITRNELEKRLPIKHYNTAINHPLLESISAAFKDDADRLRKLWNSCKIPTASKPALDLARRRKGIANDSDPTYLRLQEQRRQSREKELRRNRANANRQAVLNGEPAHTGSRVSNHDGLGRLSGDAVRDALAAKSA